MKNKNIIVLLSFFCFGVFQAQNNTFSPYSRYGLGELNQTTFAHNAGMGGACIAYKPDSMMPIFINAGNPAAYSLIKFTTLEVGGNFMYSTYKSNNTTLNKTNVNFAYGSLGFPIKNKGGAVFGIAPYSHLGYDLESTSAANNIGDVTYKFSGSGGLNKAYIGYGIMPFNQRLVKFRRKNLYVHDSLKNLSKFKYKSRESLNKLLSDMAFGFNANYIFGSMQQTARVIYPNSLLYNNTFRQRDITLGDFTANFGFQTAFTIDSAKSKDKLVSKRRALKEKVKITLGVFMALNNSLKANYDVSSYNYIINGFGDEVLRDTVLYSPGQSGTITLPLELGYGIGIKKGERINIAADFALTNWQNFKYLNNENIYLDSYRIALGMNYVPEKYAAGNGAFWKRVNYRVGANYNSGFIQLNNNAVTNYAITAGLGLPVGVGRLSSMINVGVQYGKMAPTGGTGISENYWRISFGFNFSDRWFQKFRYD